MGSCIRAHTHLCASPWILKCLAVPTSPPSSPWRNAVTASQFDTMAMLNIKAWKAVADACNCKWDRGDPSKTTWSPTGIRETTGIRERQSPLRLELPLLTLLQDMMACATHPVVFTPDLFISVHGPLREYALRFEVVHDADKTSAVLFGHGDAAGMEAVEEAEAQDSRATRRAADSLLRASAELLRHVEAAGEEEVEVAEEASASLSQTIPKEAAVALRTARKAAVAKLGRSLARFTTSYMVPLWKALILHCPSHLCSSLHVLVTLPRRDGPNLHLTIREFKEDVTVFYPNTVDMAGQMCLLPVPCRYLRLTHVQPPAPVAVLDIPNRTPWQVSCSSCLCFFFFSCDAPYNYLTQLSFHLAVAWACWYLQEDVAIFNQAFVAAEKAVFNALVPLAEMDGGFFFAWDNPLTGQCTAFGTRFFMQNFDTTQALSHTICYLQLWRYPST